MSVRGIVKISDLLHDDIRDASKAMSRSVNAQAGWIRLGMMGELYPELNHQRIKLLMLKSGSDRLLEVINAINNH
ncbi:ParD-like family protein [Klebsiella pneumoniae]|nr:ParD-like family protein [Klebsiella pneumoniae]